MIAVKVGNTSARAATTKCRGIAEPGRIAAPTADKGPFTRQPPRWADDLAHFSLAIGRQRRGAIRSDATCGPPRADTARLTRHPPPAAHRSNRRSISAVTVLGASATTSAMTAGVISPSVPVATDRRNGTTADRSQMYLMSAPL